MSTPIKEVVIQCDSRESTSQIPKLLTQLPGVSLLQSEMAIGDYQSGESLIIERKSAIDLIASILDRRIFSQVQLMKSQFERCVIILEGDPYGTRSAIDSVAIDGLLSWASVIEGVSVIFSPSVRQSAQIIYRMAVHDQHGLGYTPGLRAEKPKDTETFKRYLIEGLPGVGPEMAKKLIEHFGSARRVFGATELELCEVKGMGKTTASKIISILES